MCKNILEYLNKYFHNETVLVELNLIEYNKRSMYMYLLDILLE